MPRTLPNDRAMLAMALIGYEAEKTKIEERIKEIREALGKRSTAPLKPAGGDAAPKRRKFSAASKKRMAAAQKKRWAEIRKAAAKPTPAKAAPVKSAAAKSAKPAK